MAETLATVPGKMRRKDHRRGVFQEAMVVFKLIAMEFNFNQLVIVAFDQE